MANIPQMVSDKITAMLMQLYTALPAKIDSYDPETRTISATPVIRRVFEDDLTTQPLSIDDIPVIFPSGGGAEVTVPLKKGDQVLLIFSMRSIQDWLVSATGDQVTPTRKKTHTIQDAIAIPSIFTKQQARPANPNNLELIFGDSIIQIQEDSKIVIESGTIELGEGASQSVVLGESFEALFTGHVHITNALGAPTTAPQTLGVVDPETGIPSTGPITSIPKSTKVKVS